MKATLNNKRQFNPVSITIELETQEEFDNFYLMVNTSAIVETTLGSPNAKTIRDELDHSGQTESLERTTSDVTQEIIDHPSVRSFTKRIL